MAFHGIHEHTLDSKNRLTVPAKQRAELSGGLTIVRDGDGCLQIWPAERYEVEAGKVLANTNALTPEGRRLRRRFYSRSRSAELDSAGRVMLLPEHIEHARLGKTVVLAGAREYFEVWSQERWKAFEQELDERADEDLERVVHPA